MKKLNRLFASVLFGMSLLFINGCDPFDDLYVKMAMGTEFNTPIYHEVIDTSNPEVFYDIKGDCYPTEEKEKVFLS